MSDYQNLLLLQMDPIPFEIPPATVKKTISHFNFMNEEMIEYLLVDAGDFGK